MRGQYRSIGLSSMSETDASEAELHQQKERWWLSEEAHKGSKMMDNVAERYQCKKKLRRRSAMQLFGAEANTAPF